MLTRYLYPVLFIVFGCQAVSAGVLVYDEGNAALDSRALYSMSAQGSPEEVPVVKEAAGTMDMCCISWTAAFQAFPAVSEETTYSVPKVVCERLRLANCRLPRSPCLKGLLKPA